MEQFNESQRIEAADDVALLNEVEAARKASDAKLPEMRARARRVEVEPVLRGNTLNQMDIEQPVPIHVYTNENPQQPEISEENKPLDRAA